MTTEWITWAGGECPIPDAKHGCYELRLRDGSTIIPTYLLPINFNWSGHGTAMHIIAYRLIEKEQSDLDWLEGKIEEDLAYWTKNHDPKHEFTKGVKASHKDILHLIKQRKEAKS